MLTQMSDADWEIVVAAFRAARSRRGDKGRDDRKFLEALHYFTVHNVTWRALPGEFGKWNSVWKRFWRLSQRAISRRCRNAGSAPGAFQCVEREPIGEFCQA
jgi:transposase